MVRERLDLLRHNFVCMHLLAPGAPSSASLLRLFRSLLLPISFFILLYIYSSYFFLPISAFLSILFYIYLFTYIFFYVYLFMFCLLNKIENEII